MAPDDKLNLETMQIGPLPLVNHFIERLRLDEILRRRLTTPRNRKMDPATCIGLALRNIIVRRRPLYKLGEWASRYHTDLFGITPEQLEAINDDRIGAALDVLYDADRASMLTEIVVSAVKEFDLDLSQLHNDATSLTLFGEYSDARGGMKRGKKSLKITEGYSKDHRPDLKQLLWFLTVTADGAVPIHYKACDGNAGESPTYIETWDVLRQLTGRPDFIYVTDCKLCTNDNLMHIHSNKGRFITVIPRNWNEDSWFREHIQRNKVNWVEVDRSKDTDDMYDIWRMTESPIRSSQGFRVVWAWSTRKEEQDRLSRQSLMHHAIMKLERLETRLRSPKTKLTSREAVIEAADAAIGQIADRWVEYELSEVDVSKFRQEKRGRPSVDTTYKRIEKKRFHVEWRPRKENIEFDARSDGMFPMITNCDDFTLKDILDKYKFQPRLEKRHEQLKTVFKAVPILLKNVTRIEGLLFIYFMTLLVEAVIEREVRLSMKRTGLASLSIYPEARECQFPTTERIMELFDLMVFNRLWSDGKVVKIFRTELGDLQRQLLDLAGVSIEKYAQFS